MILNTHREAPSTHQPPPLHTALNTNTTNTPGKEPVADTIVADAAPLEREAVQAAGGLGRKRGRFLTNKELPVTLLVLAPAVVVEGGSATKASATGASGATIAVATSMANRITVFMT